MVSDDILHKYLRLMGDISRRLKIIKDIHSNAEKSLDKLYHYESIYFHLRKILEIIVKAPMLINETEYREISKSPENHWRIQQIVEGLKKINPDFYPKPIEIVKHEGEPDEFISKTSGYLTVEELIEVYNHSSSFLHIRNPLKDENPIDFAIESETVLKAIQNIENLLFMHTIHPSTGPCGDLYYIGMNDPITGRPSGNVFTVEEVIPMD